MRATTEVRLEISGYAEGAGTKVSRDLMAWLPTEYGVSGAPVFETGSTDSELALLIVTLPTGSGISTLLDVLVAWIEERHRESSITLRVRAHGSNETVVGVQARVDDTGAVTLVFDSMSTPAHYSDTDERLHEILRSLGPEHVAGLISSLPGDSNRHSTGFIGADGSIDASMMPITIYLSDEEIHEEVETAVEVLLATADLQIESRDDPILGSWFRRMLATLKEVTRSPAAREATLVAAHVADTRFVLAQDAAVTATLLQNLGPVLGALQPTKDAIIRVGALLIVKVDWRVHIFQLTAAQQAILDHRPQLARSPYEIIRTLNLTPEDHEGDGYPKLT
jgi:hypothetical protein